MSEDDRNDAGSPGNSGMGSGTVGPGGAVGNDSTGGLGEGVGRDPAEDDLANSPQDVDRSGGSMTGGSGGRGSLAEDGSAGSRGFGGGTADGDAGLTDTVAGSGFGRPDPNAGRESHRDDDPTQSGSAGMSTELRPDNTTSGAGDPGSLDSKSSASGGGPTPTAGD